MRMHNKIFDTIRHAMNLGFAGLMDYYYTCGVIDGEGCITGSIMKSRNSHGYQIHMRLHVGQNTSRIVILHTIQAVLEVGIIDKTRDDYNIYRISDHPSLYKVLTLLKHGCKGKANQIKLALYILDNWVGPSTNPMAFLTNCYLINLLQGYNDGSSTKNRQAYEVAEFFVGRGILTRMQAIMAQKQAYTIMDQGKFE